MSPGCTGAGSRRLPLLELWVLFRLVKNLLYVAQAKRWVQDRWKFRPQPLWLQWVNMLRGLFSHFFTEPLKNVMFQLQEITEPLPINVRSNSMYAQEDPILDILTLMCHAVMNKHLLKNFSVSITMIQTLLLVICCIYFKKIRGFFLCCKILHSKSFH